MVVDNTVLAHVGVIPVGRLIVTVIKDRLTTGWAIVAWNTGNWGTSKHTSRQSTSGSALKASGYGNPILCSLTYRNSMVMPLNSKICLKIMIFVAGWTRIYLHNRFSHPMALSIGLLLRPITVLLVVGKMVGCGDHWWQDGPKCQANSASYHSVLYR